jgi:hypothetical protein
MIQGQGLSLAGTESYLSFRRHNVGAGLIGGDVLLLAASHGLAAWLHDCVQAGLAAGLRLRTKQRVMYVHSVGYPA